VPFPKMVAKAVKGIGESLGWDETKTATFFREKVEPTMVWNREIGNSYTAATWFAVAHALAGRSVGETLLAFSYGSGYGAELLTLRAGELAKAASYTKDLEEDFASRRVVEADEYARLRAHHVGVK